MINSWWLIGVIAAVVPTLVWTNRMSYRQGIWDGAFNQFLPIVRREMLFYDRFRAEQILKTENNKKP